VAKRPSFQDIKPDVMVELARHANFAGVKECEGNERIKRYTDQGIVCWTVSPGL